MKIKTSRLYLRPIELGDLETLRKWRNDHKDIYFDSTEISLARQEKWFKRYMALPPGVDNMFIISTRSGEGIGTIALYDVNIDDRSATIGRVLLLETFRGKGYAQESVQALKDFAFTKMRLHRLVVETDLTNNNAISIYHKTGFSIIGMRYLQTGSTFLYRLIVVMEAINPDHDTAKPVRLINLD